MLPVWGRRLIVRQRGIASTVFEKDSGIDARSRDWSFGIYWAQSPLVSVSPEGSQTRRSLHPGTVGRFSESSILLKRTDESRRIA